MTAASRRGPACRGPTGRRRLPTLLKVLRSISEVVSEHWPWLLLALLCAVLIGRAAWSRPTVRMARDRLLLRLPVAGPLVARLQTTRLARVLATLLRGGVLSTAL